MDMLSLAIALLLPWSLGIIWLRPLWRSGTEGAWPAILGYGYFAGTLANAVIMLTLDALGLPQHFPALAGILLVLAGLGFWLTRKIPWFRSPRGPTAILAGGVRITWRQIVAGLLLLVCILRFGGFALEILWRPLYPWDAWMNWAPKALVWFEHKSLVPHLAPDAWLASGSALVYTGSNEENWSFAPLVPLIQFWVALALDRWDENLINLPWLQAAIALTLACYGQARAIGARPLFALIVCYLLVSLPLFGTHVALAGYADLWMACLYALAVMAFLRWAQDRDPRQAAILLIFLAALPFVKKPGMAWVITFLPALLAVHFSLKILGLIVLLGGSLFGAFYFTTGIALSLPFGGGDIWLSPQQIHLPGYVGEGFRFYPVWDPFIRHLFLRPNWHLFWPGAFGLLLLAAPLAWRDRRIAIPLTLAFSGLLFLFLVFFFTGRYSSEAMNATTINRALLHLVPALTFMCAVILLRISEREASDWKPLIAPNSAEPAATPPFNAQDQAGIPG